MRGEQDLEWCLTSAALPVAEAWSESLDPIPGIDIPDPPHPHRFRLGRHFERLLLAWLDAAPEYRLIAANLPVRDGKRTVGEFDFIVDTPGGVEHWEAAVKFYLGADDLADAGRWFGPNTSDRLDLKLARLHEHQLLLAEAPAAQRLLAERDLTIERSRCFMKGRLFHPLEGFEAGERQAPVSINPNHERGWWSSLAEFQARFADETARFVYLPKSLWLAPQQARDIDDPLSFWEILDLLQSNVAEQATHLAVVGEGGEISRGFVVTREWLTRVNDARAASADNAGE